MYERYIRTVEIDSVHLNINYRAQEKVGL